jgi:hypothetical protein
MSKHTLICPLRVDRKLWTGPALSKLIVYALDVAHLVLAPEPVVDYERTALFKEKARVSLDDGQYLVELRKVYDFYPLNEADFTVMASEIKPKTIEILL